MDQALFSATDRSCFQSNDKFPRVVYSGKAIMNFIHFLKVVSFAITFNMTFLLQFKVWQVSTFPEVPAKIQITISAHQKSWTKPIRQLQLLYAAIAVHFKHPRSINNYLAGSSVPGECSFFSSEVKWIRFRTKKPQTFSFLKQGS